MVNHRALTAAVIDSRDFIAARHRADTQLLLPPGARIAFTGGADSRKVAQVVFKPDWTRHKNAALDRRAQS
jgi:hypothetical protein